MEKNLLDPNILITTVCMFVEVYAHITRYCAHLPSFLGLAREKKTVSSGITTELVGLVGTRMK